MGKSEYPKVKEAKKKAKQEVFVKCWPKDDQRDALMMIFAPKDKHKKWFMNFWKGAWCYQVKS